MKTGYSVSLLEGQPTPNVLELGLTSTASVKQRHLLPLEVNERMEVTSSALFW